MDKNEKTNKELKEVVVPLENKQQLNSPPSEPPAVLPEISSKKPRKIKKKWLIGGIVGGAVVLTGIMIAILFACGIPQIISSQDCVDPDQASLVGDTQILTTPRGMASVQYDNSWYEGEIGEFSNRGLIYKDGRGFLEINSEYSLSSAISPEDFINNEKLRQRLYDQFYNHISEESTIKDVTNFRQLNQETYYAACDYNQTNGVLKQGRTFIIINPNKHATIIANTFFNTSIQDQADINEVNRSALAVLKSINIVNKPNNNDGAAIVQKMQQQWEKNLEERRQTNLHLDRNADLYGTWQSEKTRISFVNNNFWISSPVGGEIQGQLLIDSKEIIDNNVSKYYVLLMPDDKSTNKAEYYQIMVINHDDDGVELQMRLLNYRGMEYGIDLIKISDSST